MNIKFSFLWDRHPSVQLLDHMVIGCLLYESLLYCFLEWLCRFTFLPAMYEQSNVFASSPAFGVVITVVNFLLFLQVVVILPFKFTVHSLMANDVEYLLMFSFTTCIYFLLNCSFTYFAPLSNWIGFFFFFWFIPEF